MTHPHGRHPSPGAHTPPARPVVQGRVYLAMFVVLALIAVLLIGRFLTASTAPPAAGERGTIPVAMAAPAPTIAVAPAAPTPQAAANQPMQPAAAAQPFHLKASAPVSVRVPSVGIQSNLLTVGLNKDGTVEVPTTAAQAAWYRLGLTPGALGPAVILGHVDSAQGPGVFFKLGALRPGQGIFVTRAERAWPAFASMRSTATPKTSSRPRTCTGPSTTPGSD